jgi:Fe-S cluster assembly protein SufD
VRGTAAERAFEHMVRDDAAWAVFAERGLPTTHDEDWRFTSLAPLEGIAFEPAGAAAPPRAQLEAARARVGDSQLVLVANDGAAGAWRMRDTSRAKLSPFAALNAALRTGGAELELRGQETIHLLHWLGGATHPAVSPAARITARAGASATVVEHFIGAPGVVGLTNSVTELDVERGAALRYVQLQEVPETAFHVSTLSSRQDAGSRLELTSVALGARLARVQIESVLAGEGAELELDGLYLGRGAQHQDHHTTIDHALPRTTSRELFKGILDGRARGVFHGRVHVRPHAQKIDAAQTNRVLLLSDGAVVDSKPQLEIYADDVKCSHGASIGQLDPDQIFYLRTRGLELVRARALLTFAFASEVLARLPVPALRESLERSVLSWLGDAP